MMDFTFWMTTIGVSGATTVTALWAGGKYFADAWVKTRFKKALETFRTEKARELEAFRLQSSRLLDRATKIHQREIDILPTLWEKMTAALSATANMTNKRQRAPVTWNMGDAQLKAYVGSLRLDEWEKQDLLSLNAESRDANLWIKIQWQRLREAIDIHGSFHNYVISNGIFFPAELRSELRRLSDMNYDALMEFEKNIRHDDKQDQSSFQKIDIFLAGWQDGFETILKYLQGHLWVSSHSDQDTFLQKSQTPHDQISDRA